MTFFFILLFLIYLLFVGVLIVGWNRSTAKRLEHSIHQELLLSIIVPVRNEQDRIAFLLEDIRNQSYKNFEVIVVNDHSGDGTEQAVLQFTHRDSRFRLLQCHGEGKKSALTTGIQASKGKITVTTDGDCRVHPHWLRTILQLFQDEKTKMIFGGVKITDDTLFSRMQSIEFLSLIGTAAATLSYGFPSMCNGANLAIRKNVFNEAGGYDNNMHIPSGDDEFLLKKVFRLYPQGIKFISSGDAVVTTSSMKTLKEFIHQRVRWAGKWRHGMSIGNATLAIFIFCFHLSILFLPVAISAGWLELYFVALLLFTKAVSEWILLKKVAVFVDVRWHWPSFVFLQLFYPVYALSIGLISTFSSFEWKGRRLKPLAISIEKK